jgi:Dolichyl-phosphate-mannose-protein mannosyltransferase
LSIYPFSLLARTVLSPAASRYAIAMYAVTPALVLFGATSMDGVSVFFPLLATYFFHKSWSQNPVRYSLLTGLALAAAMFFTYMTVCIGFVFALEAALSSRSAAHSGRIWRNLVYAGLTFAFVYWLLFLLTNFNVIRAFNLARQAASAYRLELYSDLWHYLSVSVANLAAFLIGVGVITVTFWWREVAEGWRAWRVRRPTDLLSIALSAAVILLAFATIFCVETERVWLFLAPLPVLAAARHLDRLQTVNPRSPAWCVVLTLLFTQTLATELLLNTLW